MLLIRGAHMKKQSTIKQSKFSERIKILRKEKKITRVKLGEEVKSSEGAIRAWEKGRTEPDYDKLLVIAKYFDCTTDYLLGASDFKNKNEMIETVELYTKLNGLTMQIPNGISLLEEVVNLLEVLDGHDIDEIGTMFYLIAKQLKESLYSVYSLEENLINYEELDTAQLLNSVLTVTEKSMELKEYFTKIFSQIIYNKYKSAIDYCDNEEKEQMYRIIHTLISKRQH